MAPIEYFFGIIGLFIALVAISRGYSKELGNTLVFLVAVFVFSISEPYIDDLLNVARDVLGTIPDPNTRALRQFLVLGYAILFTSIVFASYAGRTFEYGGRQAPPPQGTLLDFGIGLVNGYLVAGTYWHYLDKYQYPFNRITLPLSATAERFLDILPARLFDSPVYWMLPVALLILLRIRG